MWCWLRCSVQEGSIGAKPLEGSEDSNEWVQLSRSPAEGVVGALLVPLELSNEANTTLTTSLLSDSISENPNQLVASIVLNITLSDRKGNSITQLTTPLTICLALSRPEKKGKRVCLGYYNEYQRKWRCEDECLTSVVTKDTKASRGTKSEILLCGETNHLTNFALLLTGSDREYPCQSSQGKSLAWISLGMVGGAVVAFVCSVLVIEVHFRWKQSQINKQLTKACLQQPMS